MASFNASHVWGVIKEMTTNLWVSFEGFPLKIGHCLGWCHIMTPVTIGDVYCWRVVGHSFGIWLQQNRRKDGKAHRNQTKKYSQLFLFVGVTSKRNAGKKTHGVKTHVFFQNKSTRGRKLWRTEDSSYHSTLCDGIDSAEFDFDAQLQSGDVFRPWDFSGSWTNTSGGVVDRQGSDCRKWKNIEKWLGYH